MCVCVCVCVVDEVYLEEECQRETYLLDDVGTIWRGVESCKVPLEWEYGQVSSRPSIGLSCVCSVVGWRTFDSFLVPEFKVIRGSPLSPSR